MPQPSRANAVLVAVLWNLVALTSAFCREIDMTEHWDAKTPLANPDKGWYHHFPDNHLTKRYPIARDSDLLNFPGMDHLYMRLAWAYLEPEEGRFDWPVIDRTIEKWTTRGLGIAFRISCRETSTDRIEQQYATPKWVMEAGANGDYYYKGKQTGPDGPWEPVFDDPVFLEKLENFLKVFGARYDGKPWLRYVDIGSVGDWGEGHTSSGSRTKYGYASRKIHVDLYRRHFSKTQLVVSDDFVYGIPDLQERQRMHQYVLDNGISYRDDSILVDWYITAHSDTYTVRSPEFFADAYLQTATVLELEHDSGVRSRGNWLGRPGSSMARFGRGKTGADYLRSALEILHATYIGYHGYADQWLAENPKLTKELLNRCGYWYFLHRVQMPDAWKPGTSQTIQITWENRGVAPAYHNYDLVVRLEGATPVELRFDSGNRHWMPGPAGTTWTESYRLQLPAMMKPGSYTLKLKLRAPGVGRDVLLALDPGLRDERGFYTIATVTVPE